MQGLKGVKVVDLSRVLAGPFCTQILADLGAEVVKVERPGQGDPTRTWAPPYGPDGKTAAYYYSAARGKRLLTLDFNVQQDLDVIHRELSGAQILVENYKPGTLSKYQLDQKSLEARYPGLIYCSITGFGLSGSLKDRPGFDAMIQAMAGIMSLTGTPEGEPMRVGVPLVDVLSGLYAVISILNALVAKSSGNQTQPQGTHIDVALFDVMISSLVNQATSYLIGGSKPERTGHGHPHIVPYQLFHAKDRALVIAAGNDQQFRSLCTALGCHELVHDERTQTNPIRVANRQWLVAVLQDKISEWQAVELESALVDLGVPCGLVNDLEQAFDLPQVAERGLVHTITCENGRVSRHVGFPVKFDGIQPFNNLLI